MGSIPIYILYVVLLSWVGQFLLCIARNSILAHFRLFRRWHRKGEIFFVGIINDSVLDCPFDGEYHHIYIVPLFSRFWGSILAKRESRESKNDIWYRTFILKYLLVEWTDFWSVCWFDLSLSRTWFPVNGVLFLSAVFEKLARTHTSILTF